MTQVAIYARQSEDVAEGIDRQIARCRALAAVRGWNVASEYRDNDTSASKRRGSGTAWATMLSDLSAGVASVVIAVDVDRLLRSMRDLVDITESGARVLTVDGEIDLTTADGEFRATMLAGIARFEVRRKSERQRRANADRSTKGRPLPGRRRFGYETDGVTPRESEAAVVRRMFAHVAEGGSLRSITAALIREGVDSGPGSGAWRVGRVRDMLANPHYGGEVRHLGAVTPSDIIVPVVDRELAAEVRAILEDPTRRTSPGSAIRHLASGIAVCGACGGPLSYRNNYLCLANLSHPTITKNRLEGRIRAEISRALVSGGTGLFVERDGASVSALVEAHRRNLAAVASTSADRDEGLLPATVARARLIDLRTARESIEAELERARAEKGAASALADIARDLLGNATEWSMSEYDAIREAVLKRFDDLDLDRRREILRALLYVQLDSGRSIERVRIQHLIATNLNPDVLDLRHADY